MVCTGPGSYLFCLESISNLKFSVRTAANNDELPHSSIGSFSIGHKNYTYGNSQVQIELPIPTYLCPSHSTALPQPSSPSVVLQVKPSVEVIRYKLLTAM